MKSTKIKRVFLSFIAAVFIATSFISFLPTSSTNAASNPTQQGGGCVGDGSSTGARSPFNSTKGLCLGQDGQQQFYQFVVDFQVDVSNVTVTGKSGGSSPINIKFVKESARRWVSTDSDGKNLGYKVGISTGSSTCPKTDGYHIININASANGQSKDLPPVNLCSHTNINDSVIYSTSQITDTGGGGATTGTIRGNLGIYRTDQFVPSNWQQGTLEQDGVISIELAGGPSAQKGTSADKWYSLQGGVFNMENVKPGTYTMTIHYNDKPILLAAGGQSEWTSGDITISFTNIQVLAGKDTWLAGSDANTVKYFNSKGDVVAVPQKTSADKTTSCVIDGVGWIVCSAANFLATVTDGIYGLIQNLLKVPVINTNISDGKNGVYNAWAIMRSFANIGFVIGFLIIIFSQVTSLGVSNYGVKKTLPRLVVAAVLVNVSFWLSAILVDLSNITGAGIYDIMSNVKNNMNIGVSANWGNIIGGLLGGTGIAVVGGVVAVAAGAAIVASGGAMAVLFLALPLVLSAVLAVLVAALILIARQAIVIILIIVSPLAFVALLLPNTEKWFSKWRSALISLLLMYPIISIVFGGAQIAGLAIMSTAGNTPDPIATELPIVIGQAVMVIPFFLLPSLILKFSGDNLTGMASSMMSRGKGLLSGVSSAARKEGRGRIGRSINTMKYGDKAPKGFVGRGVRRFGRSLDQIKDQQGNADKYLTHERSSTTRDRLAEDAAYATRSAAGDEAGGRTLRLRAQAAGEAEENEEAKTAILQANMSGAQRQTLAVNGTITLADGTVLSGDAMQRTAIQEQLRTGSYEQQEAILKSVGAGGALQKFSASVASGVASNGLGGKDPALAGKRIDEISQGNFDYDKAVKAAISEGKYTAEAFASMNDDARANVIKIAMDAQLTNPALLASLQSAAAGIQSSVEIKAKVSGNSKATAQIASLLPPPTPTP